MNRGDVGAQQPQGHGASRTCRSRAGVWNHIFASALLTLALCTVASPRSTAAAQHNAPTNEERCELPPLTLNGYETLCLDANLPEIGRLRSYWGRVINEHIPEEAFGTGQHDLPLPRLDQWKNLSRGLKSLPRDKQLRYINGYFNNLPPKSDMDNYGIEDYWATPEEFMAKGSGDCEDYAIAKYLALRYFSWPTESMWLLLVRNNANGEQHAVLAVQLRDQTFILDNLSRPAYLLIPKNIFLKSFTPNFAVNEHGFWMFTKQNGNGKNGNGKAAPKDGSAGGARNR